ncbi:serine/threonine protein phosphatase 1 [Bradyrhizobium sp. USDA 3686]|uniref:metallophosphoesterase family protein n=1 Tax=Bradyrhizobium canariense TaxID=255045 RepID=UPI00195843AF|nr:metallophosphoesterase family protein [Bradyrhizobium canariense]MBM7486706.1 serine/threonine protein phosphatase 1 [Bradyrhizobium canariense]
MRNIYAIGDVHGCFDQLQRLVELCESDAGEGRSKLIFLGDYIDRGPDSRGVIEFLMDLQKWSPDEIICLRGNHEDLLLNALEGEDAENSWLLNGGSATLYSYRASRAIDIPAPHVAWLRSLPLFHDDGIRFFVHAGVHPDRPLDKQRTRDLLWIREPFLSSDKDFGRFVVHGHTPLRKGTPDLRTNRVNVDTGAVLGLALTSAVWGDGTTAPDRFLSVTSDPT